MRGEWCRAVTATPRAADLSAVAAVIAPHLDNSRLLPRAARAAACAQDLHDSGLLTDGPHRKPQRLPVAERAAAVLQCRMSWPTAERIAAELDAAGLLRKEA